MGSSSDRSVSQWIAGVKAGDEEAARRLWERYFDRLVGLARRKLGGLPRRASDEEDLAQDVFVSLCRGAERGRFSALADRQDLWRLLLAITKHKAGDEIKHARRQKRGGGRVRGDSVFADKGQVFDVLSQEPGPEDLAAANEELHRLLALLRDDGLRKLALWRMQGDTNEEIAARLGVAVRSVERKLKLIREQWAGELEG